MRNSRRRKVARFQRRVANPVATLKSSHGKLRPARKSYSKKYGHLYGTEWWKRTRLHILNRNPVCRYCKDAPATDVDHAEPHYGDEAKFYDPDNLWPLCRKCHQMKTAWERQKRLKREYRKRPSRGL